MDQRREFVLAHLRGDRTMAEWSSPGGRRPRTPRSSQPNVVWCTDFKGKFRVGRHYCNPLTISDAHSRFLLECKRTDGFDLEDPMGLAKIQHAHA